MSVGTPELLIEAESGLEPELEPVSGEIAARSPLELFWRRLRADRTAMIALGFIVVLLLIAICAPLIVKLIGTTGPNAQDYKSLDPRFGSATGPTSHHIFGVDGLGRDVFARVLYGARVSLEVALIATTISVTIGVVAGMYAGFFRGWIDTIISRVIDVQLAFPILLLALGLASSCSLGTGCLKEHGFGQVLIVIAVIWAVLAAVRLVLRLRSVGGRLEGSSLIGPLVLPVILLALGLVLRFVVSGNSGLIKPGLTTVIFVIAFANWTYIARIIRGQVLSLREKEFVEAARSLGASNGRIIFREVLPNLVAPIIVYSSLVIPQNILFEAALSFLGVGVQPPQASWGAMIADATNVYDTAWWYMTFPGLALLITVLAFNLLGDGLLDALNPRSGR